MTDGHPGPERGEVSSSTDLLEGGIRSSRWRRRWAVMPRTDRLLVLALVGLLVTGGLTMCMVRWTAERERALRVELSVSLGVWSSSTSPLGGQVSYFVIVRNEGQRKVSVTSLQGSLDGLRLSKRDAGEQSVPAGAEIGIPVSLRLTCARWVEQEGLSIDVAVRREDGGATTERLRLGSASLVLGVAANLCAIFPDLRGRELSGPIAPQGSVEPPTTGGVRTAPGG